MKQIFEVTFHARAGQGSKTAAQLLVESAADEGKEIQAFPTYGPERSGGPMSAYARISKKPIRNYEPVVKADAVVVIDSTLVTKKIIDDVDKNGVIIINTWKSSAEIKKELDYKGKVYTLNATGISKKYFGRDIANVPMVGALLKLTNIVSMKTFSNKIKEHFLKKLGEEKTNMNIQALKEGYEKVK